MFSYKYKQWPSFSSFQKKKTNKKNIKYCQQLTSQMMTWHSEND